jgi:agmatinase
MAQPHATLDPIVALKLLLAPPGYGIPSFSASASAGLDAQVLLATLQKAGISHSTVIQSAQVSWRESLLERIQRAKVILLGAPTDTGAGIRRGAAYGPLGIREALLNTSPLYAQWLASGEVIDAGDLRVNPHLLHDEMLSEKQIHATQDALYSEAPEQIRRQLPVSPLSQLECTLSSLRKLNPSARWMILGGDHSIAWPVTQELFSRYGSTLGILQPDAHTDLLPTRLGVRYCFGTWSFHADRLLGGNKKLIQIGIRQSGKDQAHWESTTGVKQFWAREFRARSRESIAQEILETYKKAGVQALYLSNDIDGMDEMHASATGTPAPEGLSPEDLHVILKTVCAEIPLVAADLVEVAPPLAKDPNSLERTLQSATTMIEWSISHLLNSN